MPGSSGTKVPKLVGFARQVYDRMLAEATDGEWEGMISALVGGIAGHNRYTEVMTILKDCGAIEQVRRGGGAWPSAYKVVEGVEIRKLPRPVRRPRIADFEGLKSEVTAIRESLGGLDVARAIADLSDEIKTLRGEVKALK